MNSPLQDYLQTLRGQQVAVLGLGVSNTPWIRLLLQAGISVTARDQNGRDAFGGLIAELEGLGVLLRLGEDYLKDLNEDLIFRTPGMRPDLPPLQAAKARGSRITSEMEVFFQLCPCHTVGVTGSDGKTTTATIIARLLEAAGHRTFLGGNIGRPLLSDVDLMRPDDYAVLELSSFQLMTMDRSPEIAVLTNVTPNHLDMHASMAEYLAAKENLFLYQGAAGRAVFNADNEATRSMAKQARGAAILFSRRETFDTGVFLAGDAIVWAKNGRTRTVLPIKEILLPGLHNVENYMAAIAAVDGLVDDSVVREFAKTFGGVPHRIELVRRHRGVSYYNDSIASSPTRTIAGLNAFAQKVILIAGGYDKKIPFDVLGPAIAGHVKVLILTGETAPKIRAAVRAAPDYRDGCPEIRMAPDFETAVFTARDVADTGDVVLLSPACASFDQFKNFVQRGDAFKELVRSF